MSLDLARLKDVDTDRWNREWQRAWDELQLWHVAISVVRRYLERRMPQHLESVAADALLTLSTKSIQRCRTIEDIVPLLKKIAFQTVVSFLRRSWTRHEVRVPENEEGEEIPPQGGEDNLERLRDEIAERLHLEVFDLDTFVRFIVEHSELNLLEEALFREHILGRCTQQEFAAKYGLAVGSIGGRKDRVLRKIRDGLGGYGFTFPIIK